MNQLLSKMKMDMELRGFSPKTVKVYLQSVERISTFSNVQPEVLTYDHIRNYLHHCISVKKLSRSYINTTYSAIKFFFESTLNRDWSMTDIPRVKKASKLPVALSPEQVKLLFDSIKNLKHKTMLMTTYSAGLRVGELLDLKVSDIDSEAMTIRVRCGKGMKERYTVLSANTLNTLRDYYRIYKLTDFLFANPYSGERLCNKSIQQLFMDKKRLLKFPDDATLHSFVTHLLLSGTDIVVIQKLMGHSSIRTTSIYLHLTTSDVIKVVSPFDSMEVFDD